nr:5-oxoprolinase subunit PxpA [Heliophilum fasciatum]
MMTLDLNCDMGEGFGIYRLGDDSALLEQITSANIACGWHGGDPRIMRRTVAQALARGVAVGAHPGLPDREGFGRRDMNLSAQEVYDLVLYQMGALEAFLRPQGGKLHHVKPHGALYNQAAQRADWAGAIAQAVADFDQNVVLVGLAGSLLCAAGRRVGLTVAEEVFADRTYQADGSLTPRHQADALLTDVHQALEQVLTMVRTGTVVARTGEHVPIKADTICIHGDHPGAAQFAERLRQGLRAEGITIRALNQPARIGDDAERKC